MDIAIQQSMRDAELEETERKLELEEMLVRAEGQGYQLLQSVPYDGDCFFHSVAAQAETESGQALRQSIVAYLESDEPPEALKSSVTDDLLRCLRTPARDVEDSRVSQAVAEYLGCNVVVFSHDRVADTTHTHTFNPHQRVRGRDDVMLGHIVDKHFVPLKKGVQCSSKGVKRASKGKGVTPKKLRANTITSYFSKGGTKPKAIPATSTRADISATSPSPGISATSPSPGIPATSTRADISAPSPSPGISATSPSPGIPATSTCADISATSTRADISAPSPSSGISATSTRADIPSTSTSSGISATSTQADIPSTSTSPGISATSTRANVSVSHPPVTSDDFFNDIGIILPDGLAPTEVERRINSLTDGQKYHLLKNHHRPTPGDDVQQSDAVHGSHRRVPINWLNHYSFLRYSKAVNGLFCLPCALFSKSRASKGGLVNVGFRNWIKISSKVGPGPEAVKVDTPRAKKINRKKHGKTPHCGQDSHLHCVREASQFLDRIENPTQHHLDRHFTEEERRKIDQNREVVKNIAESVLFCGRQGIGLRGNNEDMKGTGNFGNFIAHLKCKAEHSKALEKHLSMPSKKNVTYTSPSSQNEIIEIIGHNLIRKKIIGEIQDAKWFALMADEVTSHNQEIISLCIRFCDKDSNIREEFIDFINTDRITGVAIKEKILEKLSVLGLDVKNVRGQTYDGAANMSGERMGLQALIRKESPKAIYTHCSSHALNLVYAHACKVQDIRNMIDKLKEASLFFNNSPKRERLLEEIVSKNVSMDASRRKTLLNMCTTRWSARHSSFQHFYQAYVWQVMALEVIVYGLYTDDAKYDAGIVHSQWDPSTKTRASSLLMALMDFNFIACFMIVYQLLVPLQGITLALQGRSQDIVSAYNMVTDVKHEFHQLREKIDETYVNIYQVTVKMAEKVGTQPSMPRIPRGASVHRNFTPMQTPQDHYRVNVAVPFLDHIITSIASQFTGLSRTVAQIHVLVPSVLCTMAASPDISDLCEVYEDDLPTPEIIQAELRMWHLQNQNEGDKADTLAKALHKCDKRVFPNLYELLKIGATMPATSAENERSFSALRRLHTYLRCSMTEQRFSGLALMNIHYDLEIDLDEVVNEFAKYHPEKLRRLNLVYKM